MVAALGGEAGFAGAAAGAAVGEVDAGALGADGAGLDAGGFTGTVTLFMLTSFFLL
jgi:hypothetical protein